MDKLKTGTLVQLKGLKGGAQYNGMQGRIHGPYVKEKGRYPIKLVDKDKILSLRTVNFDVVKEKNTTSENVDVSHLDGGGWKLVRQVKAGSRWHPATDHLDGTEEYNEGGGTFSIPFADEDFDEFLFATGDGQKWLIADKEQVTGEWYQGKLRIINKSSISYDPHQARWYRRQGCKEDPWISITDHMVASRNGDMLYGGNSDGEHSGAIRVHGGARVYIRNKHNKDALTKHVSEGIIPIDEMFDGHTTSLDYSFRGHTRKDARIIAESIKRDRVVTSITLNNNKLENEGATEIGRSLKQNGTLAKLELVSNSIGDYGAKAVADGLETNQSVSYLDLSYNKIKDEGIASFQQVLRTNTILRTLLLHANSFGNVGIKALSDKLQTNNTLTKLDVSGSLLHRGMLGDDGAAALGKALEVNNQLQKLCLYHQMVGDKGTKALFNGLKTNSTLTKLDLNKNRIGDAGAMAIGNTLQVNSSLKVLYLHGNIIGDQGGLGIAQGLKKNKTLQKIYLNGNSYTSNTKGELARVTKSLVASVL